MLNKSLEQGDVLYFAGDLWQAWSFPDEHTVRIKLLHSLDTFETKQRNAFHYVWICSGKQDMKQAAIDLSESMLKQVKVLVNLCSDLIKVHIRAVELRMAEEWQWLEYTIEREWAEKALSDAGIPVTPEFIRAQRLAVMRERVGNCAIDGDPVHNGYYAGDYVRLGIENNSDPIVRFNNGIIVRVAPYSFFPFRVYDVQTRSVKLYTDIPPQDEAGLIAKHEADQPAAEADADV